MFKLANYLRLFIVLCLSISFLPGCSGTVPDTGEEPALPKKTESDAPALLFGFPVEYINESTDCYNIDISYPFFGRPQLDQQVRIWVDSLYHDALSDFEPVCEERKGSAPLEFNLNYELFNTPHVMSVVLHAWSYTGGAHGNDSVQTMNLRLDNGDELGYMDIFANPDGLWVFLSDFVYESLRPELGDIWLDAPMFTEGLEPVESSFRHFAVTPAGLKIFFSTYQIAPYSAGPQECDVPLPALVKFVPRPGVWQ